MIGYLVDVNLKHVRLPSNTHLFCYENNFYILLQDHRRVLHSNLVTNKKFKDVILDQRIGFRIGIYLLYTLLMNVCKFHKNRTSSLALPAV